MGQHKLETQFKRQLNQRRIAPTANAWDRLDAMLTVAEEKKSKQNYHWLYIAAGILGFLFIGFVFLSQTQEMSDVRKTEVVLQQNDSISDKHNGIPIEIKISNSALVKSGITTEVAQVKIPPVNGYSAKSLPTLGLARQQMQIAESPSHLQKLSNIPNNQKSEPLPLLKSEPVVARELSTAGASPSKIQNQNQGITVNANSLLSQVDGELEHSFRVKIIKAVDKNYKSVKGALANRNNQ
ncbi:MAG: hypothetical protein H7199_02345 [Burkholderiales bacterium]|nr:hypothetical protein [Flavobacterium sp.]